MFGRLRTLWPWLAVLFLLITVGVVSAYVVHLYGFGYRAANATCEEGCYPEERNPEFTFRWTTAEARLRLPARDTPTILDLHLFGGPRTEPAEVQLVLGDGQELAHFTVDNEARIYSLILPPVSPGSELLLRSTTFRPGAADARDLGVALREVRPRDLDTLIVLDRALVIEKGLLVLLGAGVLMGVLLVLGHQVRAASTLSLCLLALLVASLGLLPSWRAWPWLATLLTGAGLLVAVVGRVPAMVAARRRPAASRPAAAAADALPLRTALLAGLGWGSLAAFLGGLSILVRGQGLVSLGQRVLVVVYWMAAYAAGAAVIFGLVGLLATLLLGLLGRAFTRSFWGALYSGLFLGLAFLVTTAERFGILAEGYGAFRWPALIAVGLLGLGMGLLAGWAIRRGIGRWQGGQGVLRPLRWPVLRAAILAVFAASLCLCAVRLAYRRGLFDRLASGRPAADRAPSAERPNIVLITVDSLRADALGAYGASSLGGPSPNLDALAQQGVLFEAATAQASWPLASVASLFTSLYPSELGIDCRPHLYCDVRLDRLRTTLAEALKGAGYRTQAFVSNPWFSPAHGIAQGFTGFEAVRPELPLDLAMLGSEQAWLGLAQDQVPLLWKVFSKGYDLLFDAPLSADDRGSQMNQRVRGFIRLRRDERFFLWVHYVNPHLPHDPAQPFPPQPYPEQMSTWVGQTLTNREQLLQQEYLDQFRSLYAGEVAEVDALIGGVLAEIEAQGLSDRTLIVVTADHGEEMGEHGDFMYGHTLYEEIVHVPLIFRGPAATASGRRVATPVGLVDVMPTLLEIAGASSAESGGRSLVPALQGQDLPEQPVYSESLYRCYYEWKALRVGDFKLIYDVDQDGVELYDLRSDPGEQRNLLESEPPRVQEMMGRLQDWMDRTAESAQALPRQSHTGAADPRIVRMLIEMGVY